MSAKGDAFFMEDFEILLEQLIELAEKGEISALRKMLCELNVVDAAQLIEALESQNRLRAFRVLPKDVSAEVFAYLEAETQAELVRSITDSELERLLDEMFLDDTVDFLEEVPPKSAASKSLLISLSLNAL